MSPSVDIVPMVVVPLTFVFVLLIILIAKAPKAGAWVLGGLLLLAPIILLRFAHAGMLSHRDAVPLFVVPITFLFVLLVILLAKAPRAGVGLIAAIVVMVVLGLFLMPAVSHRRTTHTSSTQVRQHSSGDGGSAAIVDFDRVYDDFVQVPSPPARPTPPDPIASVASVKPSPIWSEGVEEEFDADVYPSSLAAAKALGRRMAWPIRDVAGDPNAVIKVVLFQGGHDRRLIAAFGQAVGEYLRRGGYSIEADLRNIQSGEVGVTFHITGPLRELLLERQGPGKIELPVQQESTTMVATAFAEGRHASAEAQFIWKPWLEDFGPYASRRPDQVYIIARSNGTCTSESEANQQALEDAKARLTEALGRQARRGLPELARPAISTTDVLNGGFVADRFVQSFDTTTGKVWRQALLLDVSGSKLSQLAAVKIHQSRQVRESWARMGFSVIGVLVLISVIYFFLNMATRGYYEWSLRVAGVVLAIVAIVSILMIVQ